MRCRSCPRCSIGISLRLRKSRVSPSGIPTLRPAFERYTAVRNNSNERTWLWQTDRLGEEFPLGSRGGIAARHYFPVDGEYVLKVRLDKTYTGMVRGLNVPNEIEFRVDGTRVGQFTLGGPELSAAAAKAAGARLCGCRAIRCSPRTTDSRCASL